MSLKIMVRDGRPAPRPSQSAGGGKTPQGTLYAPSQTSLMRYGPDRPGQMIRQDEQA